MWSRLRNSRAPLTDAVLAAVFSRFPEGMATLLPQLAAGQMLADDPVDCRRCRGSSRVTGPGCPPLLGSRSVKSVGFVSRFALGGCSRFRSGYTAQEPCINQLAMPMIPLACPSGQYPTQSSKTGLFSHRKQVFFLRNLASLHYKVNKIGLFLTFF